MTMPPVIACAAPIGDVGVADGGRRPFADVREVVEAQRAAFGPDGHRTQTLQRSVQPNVGGHHATRRRLRSSEHSPADTLALTMASPNAPGVRPWARAARVEVDAQVRQRLVPDVGDFGDAEKPLQSGYDFYGLPARAARPVTARTLRAMSVY